MDKICTKCGKIYEKSPINFPQNKQKKDGLFLWCKSCKHKTDNVYSRKYRKNNPEWKKIDNQRSRALQAKLIKQYNKKYPERQRAVDKANDAIKTGVLIKQPCEICGQEKAHKHHQDYSKPLEVMWLCPKHHKAIHNNLLNGRELLKIKLNQKK